MKEITVKTGFGYFTNREGRITDKYIFRKGKHKIPDDFTQHEVTSQVELDKINVYKKPPTAEEVREEKIRTEIRIMNREAAIARLQARGEI